MKFVVSSSELYNRLLVLGKVVNVKSSLPIISNVLLKLEDNMLKITASDLETTLVSSLPLANTDNEGSITLPAKMFTESLRMLPDQPITISVDENYLVSINYENGNFSTVGVPADDFPTTPELKDTKFTAEGVSSDVIIDGIQSVLYAIATDEIRPIMNGMLIELTNDDITFVASDSHKLVKYTRNDVQPNTTASFILPKKPAGLLRSILTKNLDSFELSFDDRNASFVTPEYTLICKLVEGRYPAYASVIPKTNNNILTINRLDFCNALERVALFANQASNLVKLSLSGNELILSSKDIDYSRSSRETIQCQYEGVDLEIGFKAIFLIEILSNLTAETIQFKLGDPTRAGLIIPMQTEPYEDILSLLMPMTIY